jgi:D-xylulose reductase
LPHFDADTWLKIFRFKFDDAKHAFEVTRNGKSKDGAGVIKAIIDGPE